MDIIKLKYFHTVAKYQHVTQASEELHLAQPALTKSIKLLEEELGVNLFYRQGRNVKLTEYGKFLKNKLDLLLPEFDAIPTEIEKLKNKVENLVRLNVLAASNLVTDAVVEYKKKNPSVIFELIQSAEEDCDITVFTTTKNRFNIDEGDKYNVIEEEVYLAVPKTAEYLNKTYVSLKSFADANFISVGGSKQFKTVYTDFCAKAGFVPKTTFESDSALAVKKVISSKAGVGFWPEYSWGKINHAGVLTLPIKDIECKRKIIITRHKNGNELPVIDKFFSYLTDFVNKQKEKSKTETTR